MVSIRAGLREGSAGLLEKGARGYSLVCEPLVNVMTCGVWGVSRCFLMRNHRTLATTRHAIFAIQLFKIRVFIMVLEE